MKQILFCLSAVFLFACGSKSKPEADFTPEERENIEIAISMHNIESAHKYRTAAIQERTRYNIENIRLPKEKLDTFTMLHMESFASQYFNTKDIARDTALTFEKYLSWCKATGKDPKEAHKFLD